MKKEVVEEEKEEEAEEEEAEEEEAKEEMVKEEVVEKDKASGKPSRMHSASLDTSSNMEHANLMTIVSHSVAMNHSLQNGKDGIKIGLAMLQKICKFQLKTVQDYYKHRLKNSC